MRTHTAMHILCGVVFRDYGAQVTGGNMDPLEGRMAVSYTHLDVYKRQVYTTISPILFLCASPTVRP